MVDNENEFDKEAPTAISLIVKNPSSSSPGDFTVDAPLDSTVLGVKQILQRDYVGNPDPSRQKLIVAGQVLSDSLSLLDVFKNKNLEEPQVMHLVVSSFSSQLSKSKSSTSLRSDFVSSTNSGVSSSQPVQNGTSPSSQFNNAQSSSASQTSSSSLPSPPVSNLPPQPALFTNPPINYNSTPGSTSSSSTAPAGVWPGFADPSFPGSNPSLDANNFALLQQMMYGGGLNMYGLNPSLLPILAGYNNAFLGGLPLGFQYPPFMLPYYPGGGIPFPYNIQGDQQNDVATGIQQNAAAIGAQLQYGMLPFQYPFPNLPGVPGAIPPHHGIQQGGQFIGAINQAAAAAPQIPGDVQIGQLPGQGGFGQQPANLRRNQRQGRVILALRLDLMLIFKLAALVFFFNQNGSTRSTVILTILAFFYYLYQTGALTPLQRWMNQRVNVVFGVQLPQPQQPRPPAQQPPNPGPEPMEVAMAQDQAVADAQAPNVPNPVGQQQPPRRGFLYEIRMFIMGFVASLLPGFQPPENPLAANVGGDDNHDHQD